MTIGAGDEGVAFGNGGDHIGEFHRQFHGPPGIGTGIGVAQQKRGACEKEIMRRLQGREVINQW
ncbi:hypothetical protein D3C80_1744130 [compost metagenome]